METRRRRNEGANDGSQPAGNSNNQRDNVSRPTGGSKQSAGTGGISKYFTRESSSTSGESIGSENQYEFNQYIKQALEKLITGQDELKKELSDIKYALNSQGEDIQQLKEETKLLDTKTNNAWDSIRLNKGYIEELYDNVNKLERQSRRNNIRLGGYPEQRGENVHEIVESIFQEKFEREDIEIERAHRDGKIHTGPNARPRHILIKLLRYQDKVDIMKMKKDKLKKEDIYFIDDLTGKDLSEKKKWASRVKVLYKQGIYFRFVAGFWRDNKGRKAPFYVKGNTAGLVLAVPTTATRPNSTERRSSSEHDERNERESIDSSP